MSEARSWLIRSQCLLRMRTPVGHRGGHSRSHRHRLRPTGGGQEGPEQGLASREEGMRELRGTGSSSNFCPSGEDHSQGLSGGPRRGRPWGLGARLQHLQVRCGRCGLGALAWPEGRCLPGVQGPGCASTGMSASWRTQTPGNPHRGFLNDPGGVLGGPPSQFFSGVLGPV